MITMLVQLNIVILLKDVFTMLFVVNLLLVPMQHVISKWDVPSHLLFATIKILVPLILVTLHLVVFSLLSFVAILALVPMTTV
jgi:hypothetical protein